MRVAGVEPARLSTADFKSAVSTNSTILAYLVLAVGIEPTSTALQTAAMTTSAKPALFGVPWGIEPSPADSQSALLPLH